MKKRVIFFVFICTSFTYLVSSCNKSDHQGGLHSTPLVFKVPEGWPTPVYNFSGNPLTVEGFNLGRKLFYDGRLSKDGNFPCSSCHQQFAGFATFDHSLSHGFDNQYSSRNAPAIFNMVWQDTYHWDGAIENFELQPLEQLTAPNEMAETVENVIDKLQSDSSYQRLFTEAFGDPKISSQRMLLALTQFVGSITSANSRYDKMKRGEVVFNEYENQGYSIFQAKCASCHQEPLFTDKSFRNNGLVMDPVLRDLGRMKVTGFRSDSLRFKVPSIRNVMLTFPYMHDGRLKTPMDVLDHYTDGIVQSATLDPILKNGIQLDAAEKLYLLEFFKTLTDSVMITDKRFSAPF